MTEEKKSSKKPIGGIGAMSQYATIGAKRTEQPSQNSERLDVQDTYTSSTQTTEHPNTQTTSNSGVQRQKKPERVRQTVYLEQEIDEWVRDFAEAERKRLGVRRVEISDIVNNALRAYRKQHEW